MGLSFYFQTFQNHNNFIFTLNITAQQHEQQNLHLKERGNIVFRFLKTHFHPTVKIDVKRGNCEIIKMGA